MQTEYQDIKEAEEFVQGLKGLLHSQENALFLEKSEESDGDREYQSGELMINPKRQKGFMQRSGSKSNSQRI